MELSLQPAFRGRYYSEISKPTCSFPLTERHSMPLLTHYLPLPYRRPFRLLTVDIPSYPRPFTTYLKDREVIYSPNPTPSQKPVAVGPVHSLLTFLPEREKTEPAQAVPLDVPRVVTNRREFRWLGGKVPGGSRPRSRPTLLSRLIRPW